MSDVAPEEPLILQREQEREKKEYVDRKSLFVSIFTLLFSIPAIIGS